MPNLRVSSAFLEYANDLPKETQHKLFRVLKFLSENPRHPSLHVKKLHGAAREDTYECRVDRFWRILLRKPDAETLDLVFVGRHDDAILEAARDSGIAFGWCPDPWFEELIMFLEGDDTTLDFTPTCPDDLESLLQHPHGGEQ